MSMGELELTEPQFFFSGKPLVVAKGDIIETPQINLDEEPTQQEDKGTFTFTAKVKDGRKLRRLLRCKKTRLPRKLKKGAKPFFRLTADGWIKGIHFDRYPKTKWECKAFDWFVKSLEFVTERREKVILNGNKEERN